MASQLGRPTVAKPNRWHELPAEQVLAVLDTDPDGLSSSEAVRRRPALTSTGRRLPKWLRELGESLFEPLQLLLIAVGVLSAVFGELRDAIAIFVVIAAVVIVETSPSCAPSEPWPGCVR